MIKTLKFIAEQYGNDILRDGSKLIAYYSDLEPRQKTERQMLEFLIRCNGNIKLLNVRQEAQQEQQACVDTLVKQLTSQLLMSEDAAYTVCDNFLQAVGGMPIQKPKVTQQTPPQKPVTTTPPVKPAVFPADNKSTPSHSRTHSGLKKIVLPAILAVCVLIALVVGIGLGNKHYTDPSQSNTPGASNQASAVGDDGALISYMKALINTQDATGFSVYDLNADNLKELIIYSSNGSLSFYTYNSGYAVNLGSIDGSNSYLCDSNGQLILVCDKDGQEKSSVIKLSGGSVSSDVLSRTESSGSGNSYFSQFDRLKITSCTTDSPFGESFDLLNSIFIGKSNSNIQAEDSYTQTDYGFTNKKTTVATLANGWIAVVNSDKLKVQTVFSVNGEEANVVGATQKSIYVESIDHYIDDGRPVTTVTAYGFDGSQKTTHNNFNQIWFEEGYLIMRYTREYVYPCRTCVIAPNDNIVFEHDEVWSVGIYDSRVYYLYSPEINENGTTQIEIYSRLGDKDFLEGTITMTSSEGETTYPYIDGGTVVVQTEVLDDSSANWEDWEVITTKKVYTLDGTPK